MITYQNYIDEIVLGKVSKTLGTSFPNIIHGAIGLATEAGELSEAFETGDVVNIKEELGDALWYITLIFSETGMALCVYRERVQTHVRGMRIISQFVPYEAMYVRRASELLDTVKRGMFYGKGLDIDKLYDQLCKCHALVAAIARDVCECAMDEIMQLNADKLRKRYEKHFTATEANSRDLDAERKALENG